jgi:hypothetical protein
MIGAGNYMAEYKDKSGSVSRRFAIFKFLRLVTKRDPDMLTKIKKDELHVVLMRCVKKYIDCVKASKGKGFWEAVAPDELKAAADQSKEDTNLLLKFLRQGSKTCHIVKEEGSVVSLQQLNRKFKNYQEFEHGISSPKGINGDHYPIKASGFVLKTINYCKVTSCKSRETGDRQASSALCKDHYEGGSNRSKLILVYGMKFAERDRTEKSVEDNILGDLMLQEARQQIEKKRTNLKRKPLTLEESAELTTDNECLSNQVRADKFAKLTGLL